MNRSVFSFVLAMVLVAGASAAPRARGTVQAAQGQVDVFMSAFQKWRKGVKSGQQLYLGDRLRTGPGASAKVVLFNASGEDTVDVGSDTLFEIPHVVENEADTSWVGMFSQAVGRVTCLVSRKPPGKNEKTPFNVRTPTVVAGVRGTEFNVEYDRKRHTSFVLLRKGALNGLMYGGLALGAFAKNEGMAITGLKVFAVASHIKNIKDIFGGGNQDRVNDTFNRLFYFAEIVGPVQAGGAFVQNDAWKRDLPWDGPGVDADNPLVLKTFPGSSAVLHLRNTGWIQLESDTEVSVYRLGNAALARLRRGKLHFHRMDPNYKPLKYGPAMDVEFFLKAGPNKDLRVLDYTEKGGVTRATLENLPGAQPYAQASEGALKILEVQYE